MLPSTLAVQVTGLAVGRKIAAFDFPFVLGEPVDSFGGDIEQADVVIAVAGIRGDQQALSVGREVVGGVELFALVRREQRALTGGDFGDEDIGVRALGLLLGVGDPLVVGGPDGIDIHLVPGRAAGQMFRVAHQGVEDVDFEHRRGLGLHRVGEIPPAGRPGRTLLSDLAGIGDVDDLSALWRDEENVPLLIAVVVGDVGDPFAVGRPGGRGLALVAHGELCRPAACGGHQPDIVAAADVRDEGDALAIRRPGRCSDRARHEQAFDGKALLVLFHVRVGLAGDQFGIGDRLGGRKLLRQGKSAHRNENGKQDESTHTVMEKV